jgi:uncharacterized protein
VDVGVHQDGLVHISELSNHYVKDPSDAVKVGQIVKVRVLNADTKTKRIALSMKTPGAKPQGQSGKPRPTPKPEPTMEDKLAALTDRWKKR